MSNFKTTKEEIEYLGMMITATMPNDVKRIDSICNRLQELKEINRLQKPKDDLVSQVTSSPLKDIAYLANKFAGDKLKPRGNLSKIKEFHKTIIQINTYQ